MNAGGVRNTCKLSDGVLKLAIAEGLTERRTGEYNMRSCPKEGDNVWKRTLIPHKPEGESSDVL